MGVLSQLRVTAPAHPEPAAPRPARPSETGQAVAVSALLTVAWHLVTPLGRPGRDAVNYLRIATDPRAAVRSADNDRVLLLWPMHWLGGDPWRTYLPLTMGELAASGPLVYLPPLAMLLATTRELAVGLVLLVYVFLARRRGHLFAATVALALWWPRLPVRHG